jgi:hypothetical protein
MSLHTGDWMRIGAFLLRLLEILVEHDPKEKHEQQNDEPEERHT